MTWQRPPSSKYVELGTVHANLASSLSYPSAAVPASPVPDDARLTDLPRSGIPYVVTCYHIHCPGLALAACFYPYFQEGLKSPSIPLMTPLLHIGQSTATAAAASRCRASRALSIDL